MVNYFNLKFYLTSIFPDLIIINFYDKVHYISTKINMYIFTKHTNMPY